ncbi:MAG: radical SAM protein, partial [Bacteroidales bacterium]
DWVGMTEMAGWVSPKYAVIKSAVESEIIKCEINYINIRLSHSLFFLERKKTEDILLPFLYLYNLMVINDVNKSNLVKQRILCTYAHIFFVDKEKSELFFNQAIDAFYNTLCVEIERIINDKPIIIGFSTKYYQWVPIILCSYIIKQKSNTPILVGGWNIMSSAKDFMEVCKYIDYSIWGEGEISVKELINAILDDLNNIEKIPRLIYRDPNITINSECNNGYIDISQSAYCDYSDFIKQQESTNIICLPIERIRGCNWNKCRFCYLSQGYLYRKKSTEKFINEIKYYIKTYNIYKFELMDNDFIGDDLIDFNYLLEGLIRLKSEYDNFKIILVEIITKGIDKCLIEKMSEAGINGVQIGFESLSQSLLTKMRKKQNFAENLFFIKQAYFNGINVLGLNVIMGLPDETNDDIYECINNLHFFRFFYKYPKFKLVFTRLAIANYSSYLSQIKKDNTAHLYTKNPVYELISDYEIKSIDRFSLFEFIKQDVPTLWESVIKLQEQYYKMKFSYDIIYYEGSLIYKEYANNKLIKEIEFDEILLKIIILLQDKVLTYDEMLLKLINDYKLNIKHNILENYLNFLYKENIVYYSSNRDDITTIIEVDINKLNLSC